MNFKHRNNRRIGGVVSMFGTEGELEIILESECVVKVELCCVTVVLFFFLTILVIL